MAHDQRVRWLFLGLQGVNINDTHIEVISRADDALEGAFPVDRSRTA
jgi:hypothetical protein